MSLHCTFCFLQEAVAEKYFAGTNMKKDAVILSSGQLRQCLRNVRVGIEDINNNNNYNIEECYSIFDARFNKYYGADVTTK